MLVRTRPHLSSSPRLRAPSDAFVGDMTSAAWWVAALLTGVMVLDGLDLLLASLSAPVLAREWSLTKSALAPLLAAALIGMTVGSLVGSWAADRIGRRPVVVASVLLFGVGAIACGFAGSAWLFGVLRFASGVGFGAATPCVAAMMSESIPQRRVGRALGVMSIGIPVGGALCALVTSWVLPRFGWRPCFLGAGGLCLAFALLLFRRLPESPSFIEMSLGRSMSGAPGDRPARQENRFRLLFASSNRRVNAGLYLASFASALAIYASGSWLTIILTELKLPLAIAIRGTAVTSLAAIIGSLTAGWMVARLGSRAMLLLAVTLGFTAALTLAAASGTLQGDELKIVMFAGLCLFGLFTGGIQPSLYLVAARAYPAQIRSTGLGMNAVVARAGTILSSFAGSALLALSGASGFYVGIAVLVACAALAILLIDRHTPGVRVRERGT